MSRYSLYTAVRRRGGAPGRPLHRSAPPASARSRSRAESYVCPARLRASASGRSSLQVSVSRPTAGCRRDDVARARRAVGSRVPIRVVRSWTQRTGRVQWPRGWAAIAGLRWRRGVGAWAGGTAAFRLSLIPAMMKEKIPHSATLRLAANHSLFSAGRYDVPRPAPAATRRATPRAQMSIASSLSHLEPNRTSLASTVTPGVLFSFLRNKRLASSLSP